MPKLEATSFRVAMSERGECTLSFQSDGRREFHVRFGGPGLSQLMNMMTESLKNIQLPVSVRQTTGYRKIATLPHEAVVDVPEPDKPGMIYGAAVSTDLTMVVPYFNFPNDGASGFKQVAISLPAADAQKLVLDLQKAIEVVVNASASSDGVH